MHRIADHVLGYRCSSRATTKEEQEKLHNSLRVPLGGNHQQKTTSFSFLGLPYGWTTTEELEIKDLAKPVISSAYHYLLCLSTHRMAFSYLDTCGGLEPAQWCHGSQWMQSSSPDSKSSLVKQFESNSSTFEHGPFPRNDLNVCFSPHKQAS